MCVWVNVFVFVWGQVSGWSVPTGGMEDGPQVIVLQYEQVQEDRLLGVKTLLVRRVHRPREFVSTDLRPLEESLGPVVPVVPTLGGSPRGVGYRVHGVGSRTLR